MGGGGACVCVSVCVVRPFLLLYRNGPILDENLAWHMLPATAGMKYIGSTFIVNDW